MTDKQRARLIQRLNEQTKKLYEQTQKIESLKRTLYEIYSVACDAPSDDCGVGSQAKAVLLSLTIKEINKLSGDSLTQKECEQFRAEKYPDEVKTDTAENPFE